MAPQPRIVAMSDALRHCPWMFHSSDGRTTPFSTTVLPWSFTIRAPFVLSTMRCCVVGYRAGVARGVFGNGPVCAGWITCCTVS